MSAGGVCCFDHRSVGNLVGMRPDFIQGNFWVFKWVFNKLSVDYRDEKEEYFLFKRTCYFLFFQEKVSSFNLYQYYASNSCVTNAFAEA